MKPYFLLFIAILLSTPCLAQDEQRGQSSQGKRSVTTRNEAADALPIGSNAILMVDGVKYKTLASSLAACAPPGCVVYDNLPETFTANPFASLPSKVFAEVHLLRRTWITNASIVVPNKSQMIGSGRGDAGSTGTVIQAGPSFPASTPVVQMGSAPIAMGVRVENLTVDCENKVGATGVRNTWSQEESGLRHVLIVNCPAAGLDVETSAAQNSGPYEDLEVLSYGKCSNCSAATVPVIVREVAAFRGIHGATINSDGAPSPGAGIQIDSSGSFTDIHCEHVDSCLLVGSQRATSAVTASNIECGPATLECVLFSNAYNSRNLTVLGVVATSGNLVADQINDKIISASAEGGSLGMYSVGGGKTQSVITSSPHLNSRFPGVALLGSEGGSITHVAPPVAGTNTITDPAATGTASLAAVENCGSTQGETQMCARSLETLPIIVRGTMNLNSGASQSITKLPFTDALFSCTGSDETTPAGVVSFSSYKSDSVIIRETNGATTDRLRYVCVGH
ncbi:MAG TPA: hypothetical protein VK709_19190 [Candidatus Saccharimonadales bacterium]|jgi:hypothetical protein|nr:hypothetical protein [Candidatus Saccharimonadales bacterium]